MQCHVSPLKAPINLFQKPFLPDSTASPAKPTTTSPFPLTTLAKSPFQSCAPTPNLFAPYGLNSPKSNGRLSGRPLRLVLPCSCSGVVYLAQGLGEGDPTCDLGFECEVVAPFILEMAVKELVLCPQRGLAVFLQSASREGLPYLNCQHQRGTSTELGCWRDHPQSIVLAGRDDFHG